MCLLFFPPNQELQLGMAGYDGHRVDDADLIDVPVTLQVACFGGLPGSFCMAALPPHCLGCRALPSGSLRVEYTQSRSSVRYKWVLWSCSSGGCCQPRRSEIKWGCKKQSLMNCSLWIVNRQFIPWKHHVGQEHQRNFQRNNLCGFMFGGARVYPLTKWTLYWCAWRNFTSSPPCLASWPQIKPPGLSLPGVDSSELGVGDSRWREKTPPDCSVHRWKPGIRLPTFVSWTLPQGGASAELPWLLPTGHAVGGRRWEAEGDGHIPYSWSAPQPEPDVSVKSWLPGVTDADQRPGPGDWSESHFPLSPSPLRGSHLRSLGLLKPWKARRLNQ